MTDINYKITDTKQYLHYQSNHPRHIKGSISYNLAHRICTIVDTDGNKERRLDELSELSAKRGYPKDFINFGINKAKTSKLEDLRGSRAPANTDNVLTAVSTFNPNNPPIDSLPKQEWNSWKAVLGWKQFYNDSSSSVAGDNHPIYSNY